MLTLACRAKLGRAVTTVSGAGSAQAQTTRMCYNALGRTVKTATNPRVRNIRLSDDVVQELGNVLCAPHFALAPTNTVLNWPRTKNQWWVHA